MTAVHLFRLDPARNMRRFYHLDVQPDLFGGVMLIKEWGRIGGGGRLRSETYANPAEARAALEKHQRVKLLRGYRAEVLNKNGDARLYTKAADQTTCSP